MMKRLSSYAASIVIALAALPGLAQQGPSPDGPGRFYGYHHMWDGGWGWHPGMIFGPLLMLLVLLGIAALIMRVFCHGRHGTCPHCGRWRSHGALDILEERLAKGEIGKEEFEEKRKLLGR